MSARFIITRTIHTTDFDDAVKAILDGHLVDTSNVIVPDVIITLNETNKQIYNKLLNIYTENHIKNKILEVLTKESTYDLPLVFKFVIQQLTSSLLTFPPSSYLKITDIDFETAFVKLFQ